MRLIHSSDWHLGHSLHGSSRDVEHRAFLSWLLDRIEEEKVQGMILAGDLFDSANPPVSALRLWYKFLRDLSARAPGFQLILIGGNHDSASRLEAPRELIQEFGVQVVGGLPRTDAGDLDLDRLLLELEGPTPADSVLVAALPFVRMADLPRTEGGEQDPVGGVRQVYGEVLAEAARRRRPDQALIVTGHCYMVAGKISELSERKILGGDQHALPLDLFPDDVDYVALGHLHLAQALGGRDNVRYCGSPIPLSLAEKDYPHQVLLLDVEGGSPVAIQTLRVPRHIEILRIPEAGPGPMAQVLTELQALPALLDGAALEDQPLLEVRVHLEAPEPGLRRRVEEALDGLVPEGDTPTAEPNDKPKRQRKKKKEPPRKRAARLVKLTIERSGKALALSEETSVSELRELEIEEVFRKRYAQVHDGEVEARILQAFRELHSHVLEEGAP
jgi:DNA repair protein SbcD/Mre11